MYALVQVLEQPTCKALAMENYVGREEGGGGGGGGTSNTLPQKSDHKAIEKGADRLRGGGGGGGFQQILYCILHS